MIKEANDSPYGLAAGVFTSNIERTISEASSRHGLGDTPRLFV